MQPELLMMIAGGLFTVLWYLLRQKDVKQQEEINLLFKKHDDDAKELQDLRVQIASHHYVKGELDIKFDKLETSFRDEMRSVGTKIDRMTDAILEGRTK